MGVLRRNGSLLLLLFLIVSIIVSIQVDVYCGESDYETYPVHKDSSPALKYQFFEKSFTFLSENNTVQVQYVVIEDPLNHMSIQLPEGTPCTTCNTTFGTSNLHGCLVSMNAGFFNFKPRYCLGNIFSDSKPVQTCTEMVNFGLLNNGSFITGYLSCPDTKSNLNIKQMVSGIGWLVRNSKNYLSESVIHEKIVPGLYKKNNYRSVIGHDKEGRLILVTFSPSNMNDMAEILLEMGAVNAINLDGSGSSALITEGIQRNECVDLCKTKRIDGMNNICPNAKDGKCERCVTTIVCVK